MIDPAKRTVRTLASVAGGALAGATRTVAAVRPAGKPLHPAGTVVEGVLTRHGAEDGAETGVDLLDRPGQTAVTARLSRGVGLPKPVPDVWGLALRLTQEGETGDLLFASTGWNGPLRHLLVPRWEGGQRPLTTLLPYRTPTGPVVLGAWPVPPAEEDGGSAWTLSWARGLGPWHEFGRLDLERAVDDDLSGSDEQLSFDPVQNKIPGLEQYPVVARLRRPAYRTARASRDQD
ncbi:hypothetical protein INN71_00860 [Nocardioides sp. ChNu-153]|uniref:hypothetical protein n=1 Tax=unclassified Nocardioides TaxID=2615069 RepID=UPI0024059220|nr:MULTISPECIES: hypothetical protein [unclassified Nocardioides]MDF9714532.1 hypothetical protein [Nocardioides sp. ChNu-99]MDN7119935.1 hypothetical protein [Nocardioides sp. ChNu-153]